MGTPEVVSLKWSLALHTRHRNTQRYLLKKEGEANVWGQVAARNDGPFRFRVMFAQVLYMLRPVFPEHLGIEVLGGMGHGQGRGLPWWRREQLGWEGHVSYGLTCLVMLDAPRQPLPGSPGSGAGAGWGGWLSTKVTVFAALEVTSQCPWVCVSGVATHIILNMSLI